MTHLSIKGWHQRVREQWGLKGLISVIRPGLTVCPGAGVGVSHGQPSQLNSVGSGVVWVTGLFSPWRSKKNPEFTLGDLILKYWKKYKYLRYTSNNNKSGDHINAHKGKVENIYQTPLAIAGNKTFNNIEMQTMRTNIKLYDIDYSMQQENLESI